MMSNQGFSDFDRLRHRSPSPMASSNLMSSVTGSGLGGWNGLPQEVNVYLIHSIPFWYHFSSILFLYFQFLQLPTNKLAICVIYVKSFFSLSDVDFIFEFGWIIHTSNFHNWKLIR